MKKYRVPHPQSPEFAHYHEGWDAGRQDGYAAAVLEAERIAARYAALQRLKMVRLLEEIKRRKERNDGR